MPEPCRSCPQKEIDFSGCRCQAALLTGDPGKTDPACEFSPHHRVVREAIETSSESVFGDLLSRRSISDGPRRCRPCSKASTANLPTKSWPVGMAILRAILAGERDALKLAKMKHPHVKASTEQIVQALEGDYRAEHLFALQTA